MSAILRMSLRAVARDWRSGELRVMALAIVVAVAAVTAVGFFTSRVERAMAYQATELLGADLVVESARAIRPPLREDAARRGLQIADTVEFPSVVLVGETTALTEVKAVSASYPLRGRLRVSTALFGAEQAVDGGPAPGEVWVEGRLLAQLGLKLGDPLQLGYRELTVTHILTYEPDRGGALFRFAPRVLLNLDDLESTRLVGPASRVRHRMLVAGPEASVRAYRGWVEAQLQGNEEIEGIEDARPEVQTALDRAQRFLSLAALVAVLLGGAAIAVAARHFAERQADAGAILRCLGASQRQVLGVFALRLLWLCLAASLAGALLGYAAQLVLAALLGQWFSMTLPQPSLLPLLAGLLTGVVTLAGFALPPILRLRAVPPLRVLRRDLGAPPPSAWSVGLLALAAMAGLMLWQARDPKLAALVMAGTLAAVVALGLLAAGSIAVLKRFRQGRGLAWRFGLAGLARRGWGSVVQLSAIGLGIMALLLLAIVRVDLLETWERQLPADAPDHFLINVQRDELGALRTAFEAQGMTVPAFYPMIRGRLVAIAGREVGPEDYENPRAQRLVAREFNLSFADHLQADNAVLAGEFWMGPDAAPQFSVEEGLASALGIRLGDTLRFDVAGELVEATVTSLRSVQWDSFNANFFVLSPPSLLEPYPATYISAFHLGEDRGGFLVELVRAFPSVTVFDVRALLRQVRAIMDRATLAVEFVFLFTLAAGLTVLYAAIQATREDRIREGAILRTLGAHRRQVLKGIAAEFTGMGLLAGGLAASAASLLGWALATRVFELEYTVNPWLWLVGLLGGGLGVGLAGVLGTRQVLARPPLTVLRQR